MRAQARVYGARTSPSTIRSRLPCGPRRESTVLVPAQAWSGPLATHTRFGSREQKRVAKARVYGARTSLRVSSRRPFSLVLSFESPGG